MSQIVISHSELESAQRCPMQHRLGYIERWRKDKSESSAAGIGTLWHEILAAHYLQIKKAQDAASLRDLHWTTYEETDVLERSATAVQKILKRVSDQEVADKLRWMYTGHVSKYGTDREWRIDGIEYFGMVPLKSEHAWRLPRLREDIHNDDLFQFKYWVDLLVTDLKGRTWVVDHKSVHNMPNNLDIDLDSQFDRYTWALQLEGTQVFGQIHSYARRRETKKEQLLDDRFKREMTHRSKTELTSVANDMFLTAYQRYQQNDQLTSFGIETPRHTSARHCNFVCDYTTACFMGRKGLDTREYLHDLGFRQGAPRHEGSR